MAPRITLPAVLIGLLSLSACKIERAPAPSRPPPSSSPSSPSASMTSSAPAPSVPWAPVLRPVAPGEHPIAAHQSIAFPKGNLKIAGPVSFTAGGQKLSGIAKPATFWPDGSVQWLSVDAVSSEGLADTAPLPLKIGGAAPTFAGPRMSRIEAGSDGIITWVHVPSGQRFTLTPEASLLRIRKPKPEPSADPVYLDREGQYLWAMPYAELTDRDQPIALQPRLLRQTVEEENALYTVICLQGNGGDRLPASGLEWQLRLKLYHALPIVRAEMTWLALWDVRTYALHSAKWTLRSAQPWSGFSSLEADSILPRLLVENDAKGSGAVTSGTSPASLQEWPGVARDGLVAATREGLHLAVGIPNFSRLGPNHLLGQGRSVEIASWSERSGRALDLRRSTTRADYGTNDVDFKWNGNGVSRTLYVTLALTPSSDTARALARFEANRDHLWFVNAADLYATQALGPYGEAAISQNPEMVRGMQANLHFLRASRDYWRWNGWANFGDIRTNHALGNDAKRGLHAGHWALNGRYGWRNTSGSISAGFLQIGILTADRSLILAGLDNAEHIIDVDAFHGSFFSENTGDEGGMRRRNRDHWSGSVQAQYSPCYGLYLTQWLTGNRRVLDTLKGLRGYSSRNNPGNSVFPAAAWLFHYQETHHPTALAEANRLLDSAATWWKEYSKTPLEGLAALYAGNFRRVSDGVTTLISFHQATNDPLYLKGIEASASAHPISPQSEVSPIAHLYEQAYLRSQGVTSFADTAFAQARFAEYIPTELPSSDQIRQADYAKLREVITTQLPPAGHPMYRESASIAGRAVELPMILEQYGRQVTPLQKP